MRRLLVPLLFVACTSVTDAPSPIVQATDLIEAGPLVRALKVELQSPAPLTVRYGTAAGPDLEVRSAQALAHDILLSRLRAERAYRYDVVGTSHSGSFETGPLPSDLARMTFAASGNPTMPLVLLHLYDPEGFKGYAIVDGGGQVVWFWRTRDFPFGMTRRQNGNFVFMDKDRGLVEVTVAGDVLHELPQDVAHREMHHDVISTPRNSLLFIAFDAREVRGKRVKGESIWEWSPEEGSTVKRWSSWEHLSVVRDRGTRFGTEWLHANSLAIGPRSNVLLSVHYLNQIISISPNWLAIEWRLGGVNPTMGIDEREQFFGQHTAREISPGRVVLFDNRLEKGDYSRALEFELGLGTAHKVWEWRPKPDNFAFAVSSARRLLNGNTLVAFGMSAGLNGSTGPTEVYEVSPSGEVLWRLIVTGPRVMYRAEPIASIGAEKEVVESRR
ncbi:MAG: aryl-sulfate sulfotransferase [Gemmatimonadetes bacterium]|nr:aryl-sulfate sulfotransferase [Gemmatimonadota bacterium]